MQPYEVALGKGGVMDLVIALVICATVAGSMALQAVVSIAEAFAKRGEHGRTS